MDTFTPTKNVGAFRFWCQKVLPAVYDDSLSYYELLCKITSKLNEVIDSANASGEAVAELQQAYVALKGYVDDFFSADQFNEALENEIDRRITSGELFDVVEEALTRWEAENIERINENSESIVRTRYGTPLMFYPDPVYKRTLPVEEGFYINGCDYRTGVYYYSIRNSLTDVCKLICYNSVDDSIEWTRTLPSGSNGNSLQAMGDYIFVLGVTSDWTGSGQNAIIRYTPDGALSGTIKFTDRGINAFAFTSDRTYLYTLPRASSHMMQRWVTHGEDIYGIEFVNNYLDMPANFLVQGMTFNNGRLIQSLSGSLRSNYNHGGILCIFNSVMNISHMVSLGTFDDDNELQSGFVVDRDSSIYQCVYSNGTVREFTFEDEALSQRYVSSVMNGEVCTRLAVRSYATVNDTDFPWSFYIPQVSQGYFLIGTILGFLDDYEVSWGTVMWGSYECKVMTCENRESSERFKLYFRIADAGTWFFLYRVTHIAADGTVTHTVNMSNAIKCGEEITKLVNALGRTALDYKLVFYGDDTHLPIIPDFTEWV